MLEKDTLIPVQNRGTGVVVYKVQDLGVKRTFQPNEIKEIPMIELVKLSYTHGGRYILDNCLIIKNEEAAIELVSGMIQPEYWYTDAEIKELLEKGSLDQLLDCLDFAPKGVIETIKDMAVKLRLNDISKREAIFNKTGFDVNNAIRILDESKEDNSAQEETATKRRAPVMTKSAEPERRTPRIVAIKE